MADLLRDRLGVGLSGRPIDRDATSDDSYNRLLAQATAGSIHASRGRNRKPCRGPVDS